MKKSILTLLTVAPLLSSAQSYGSSGGSIVSMIIAIVFCIFIFLALREVMMWYWKINKMIDNQDRIIKLLEDQHEFNEQRAKKLDKHQAYIENNIYSIKDHITQK